MLSGATSLLLSAADVKALDTFAGNVAELMERAGQEIAMALLESAPQGRFVFLIGQGNNGGDGLVAARLLHMRKIPCLAICVEPARSDLVRHQYQLAQQAGVTFAEKFSPDLGDIVVDCIYGIGFRPPVPPAIAEVMESVKAANKYVIAVDLPSGLNADASSEFDEYIPPKETLAIDSYKFAHLNGHAGHVRVIDIGIPEDLKDRVLQGRRIVVKTDPARMGAWQDIGEQINKFTRGHVVVIGGSEGNDGAVALSSLAAYRAGAGWVSTGVLKGRNGPDELVYADIQTPAFAIDVAKLKAYVTNKKVSAIVVGPGCTSKHLHAESMRCLAEFSQSGVSVIFDAGALHGIADFLQGFAVSRTILLPHPGEWVKMGFAWSREPIRSITDMHDVARNIRTFGGATFIYKSARPVIFSQQNPIVLSAPTRRLARAGTGDVVAGATAALTRVSSHIGEAFERAYSAVLRASEAAAKEVGADSVLASDYIAKLGLYI